MTDKPTPGNAALRDLLLRADDAAKQLERMSREPHNRGLRSAHLVSKAEGVRLVIGSVPENAASDEWELAKAVLYAMRQVAHGNGIGYCVDQYLPEPLRSNILVQAGQESFDAV